MWVGVAIAVAARMGIFLAQRTQTCAKCGQTYNPKKYSHRCGPPPTQVPPRRLTSPPPEAAALLTAIAAEPARERLQVTHEAFLRGPGLSGRAPYNWLIGDGEALLMIRQDGFDYLCNESSVRQVTVDRAELTRSASGEYQELRLATNRGTISMLSPRPPSQVDQYIGHFATAIISLPHDTADASQSSQMPPGANVADSLEELNALLERGLITEEEHAAKRAEVLKRI